MSFVSWDQAREHDIDKPVFNYLDASLPHSLYRNGRVSLRRGPDGNDSGLEGYIPDAHEMPVLDARSLENGSRPTLERQGVARVEHTLDRSLDFLDHNAIIKRYYPECAALMKHATGAAHVFAFDHNVRWAQGQREQTEIKDGQKVQGPIRVVHGDYTLTSGPQRLRDLSRPPRINDTMRPYLHDAESLIPPELVEATLAGGRFALINVWRNIAPEPIQRDPLGFIDADTIDPSSLAVFEIHYSDRVGENYFIHHNDRHRWMYWSHMHRDEAVLIKQWDSAGTFARTEGQTADRDGDLCTMNFHSAFELPDTPEDAPERRSIEVRCAVVF